MHDGFVCEVYFDCYDVMDPSGTISMGLTDRTQYRNFPTALWIHFSLCSGSIGSALYFLDHCVVAT